MARSKSSSRQSNRRARRDIYNPIANRHIRLPRTTRKNLYLIEDRRTYHPDGQFRPIRTYRNQVRRFKVSFSVPPVSKKIRTSPYPSPHIGFPAPRSVLVCVRRKQRKEVMFAKNKAGRRGQRPPRRNFLSEVHC